MNYSNKVAQKRFLLYQPWDNKECHLHWGILSSANEAGRKFDFTLHSNFATFMYRGRGCHLSVCRSPLSLQHIFEARELRFGTQTKHLNETKQTQREFQNFVVGQSYGFLRVGLNTEIIHRLKEFFWVFDAKMNFIWRLFCKNYLSALSQGFLCLTLDLPQAEIKPGLSRGNFVA